jgi:thiamine-phosphate pyrophosphorylase
LGAQGVHVGQEDVPPDEARRVLGEDAIVGLSITDASQLERGSTSGYQSSRV